jgi:hypothetical protein
LGCVLLVDASHLVPSECLLKELHGMTGRIERLSKVEHEMISEVHPQVTEIKEHVENVRQAVEP